AGIASPTVEGCPAAALRSVVFPPQHNELAPDRAPLPHAPRSRRGRQATSIKKGGNGSVGLGHGAIQPDALPMALLTISLHAQLVIIPGATGHRIHHITHYWVQSTDLSACLAAQPNRP